MAQDGSNATEARLILSMLSLACCHPCILGWQRHEQQSEISAGRQPQEVPAHRDYSRP